MTIEQKDEGALPDLGGPGKVPLAASRAPAAGLPDLGGPGTVPLAASRAPAAGLPDAGGPGNVPLAASRMSARQTSGSTDDASEEAVHVEFEIARGAAGGTVNVNLAVSGMTGEELEALWREQVEPIVKRLHHADTAAS